MKRREDAEYCILTAAKLIAPHIEDTFSAGKFVFIPKLFCNKKIQGYDWCVDALKSSEYAKLAGDLEINKAVMYLKQRQLPEAVETLKALDKESNTAVNAATNLCFIYYLVSRQFVFDSRTIIFIFIEIIQKSICSYCFKQSVL